jgi:hypothetical protein
MQPESMLRTNRPRPGLPLHNIVLDQFTDGLHSILDNPAVHLPVQEIMITALGHEATRPHLYLRIDHLQAQDS